MKPKNTAANVAPTGCQRPMITAASAMKPLPAEMSLSKDAGRADGEVGAAEAGEDAAEEHGLPAHPVDLDADRVGGLGVLADRADPQAPPGLEQQEGHDDDRDVHQVDQQRLVEQRPARGPGCPTSPGIAIRSRTSGSLRYCLISGRRGSG